MNGKDLNLRLSVTVEPHMASYEPPEDHYAEFVREVSITLYNHVTADDLLEAEVFLIESIDWASKWAHLHTREAVRQFVRRAIDQIDAELILIERESGSFSEHFEGFFECYRDEKAPYLIYSKAYRWPSERGRSESEPYLPVTSPGGTA